jgi:hypothetical protein
LYLDPDELSVAVEIEDQGVQRFDPCLVRDLFERYGVSGQPWVRSSGGIRLM